MTKLDIAVDEFETTILLALMYDGRQKGTTKKRHKHAGGRVSEESDLGQFCPKGAAYPKSVWVADPQDEGRLYTNGEAVVNPVKAIGSRLEAGLLTEGRFKWNCLIPMPKPPRGMAAITNKPVKWFTWHFRDIGETGPETYIKTPLALSEGKPARLKPLGFYGYDSEAKMQEDTEQLNLILSVFEDAIRTNSMLATVEEGVKLKFPVGTDAYKSFFKLRDGLRNTPTGRRNPILHWCSEHLRKTPTGDTPVSAHKRGAHTLTHGAMTLTIEENDGYEAYL